MKAVGVIVEYNPFHNGHRLHLKKIDEIDNESVKIAVMSGDFVQRGEPAIINRWKRAEIALKSGVDIVVELPSFYSCQSAEIFAKGAIGILNELQCSKVVFGSETSNIEELKKIALLEESQDFKDKIRYFLKSGDSYPTAHSKALKEISGKEQIKLSNDILGAEYIKAIKYWNSTIEPVTILREKVSYHSIEANENIASATGIRQMIKNKENIKKYLPKESYDILTEEIEKEKIVDLEKYYSLIRYEIIRNKDNLLNIQDMENGFENRLYESAIKNSDFKSFYKEIESRRFTYGRTQRILIHILLGITKELTENIKKEISYVRIMGFNKKGREYLNYLKRYENKKIISSLKNIQDNFSSETRELIEFNERASTIYKMQNYYEDRKIPIIIKD
ncbi:MAG: nucleotidyltransferase [Fusobacterium sp.]|nr:nucleotidyltransferase [Fusobacterium sp.]